MKKILTILVSVIFVLALSACTQGTNSGSSGNEQSTTASTASVKAVEDTTYIADNTQQTEQSTQQSTQNTVAQLTREEALDIALQQAGVTKDTIRDLETELDRDNGITVWEIDFESGNTEYSFDINAETGDIVERDQDRFD